MEAITRTHAMHTPCAQALGSQAISGFSLRCTVSEVSVIVAEAKDAVRVQESEEEEGDDRIVDFAARGREVPAVGGEARSLGISHVVLSK